MTETQIEYLKELRKIEKELKNLELRIRFLEKRMNSIELFLVEVHEVPQ
jgi:hypothetical protein